MARLERQMQELRRLRNSAKGLLREDVALMKGERGGKTVAPRLADSANETARKAASEGAQLASVHKAKIGTGVALGVGAFAVWIFRGQIERAFGSLMELVAASDPVQDDEDQSDEIKEQQNSTVGAQPDQHNT